MAPSDEDFDGEWGQYKRLILAELKRNQAEVQEVNRKLDEFRAQVISQVLVDIAMLKVKAGVWGGVAGLVTGVGALLIWMATNQ